MPQLLASFFTENLLENTDGVRAPHQCSLGMAACYLLFMLTAALLMTSSHSEGLVFFNKPEIGPDELFDVVGEDVGRPEFEPLKTFCTGEMPEGQDAMRVKKFLGNAIAGGKCKHQSEDKMVRCDNLPAGSKLYCTVHTCCNPACAEPVFMTEAQPEAGVPIHHSKEKYSDFCKKHHEAAKEKAEKLKQGGKAVEDEVEEEKPPCCPCLTSCLAQYSPKVLAVKHPIVFSVINTAVYYADLGTDVYFVKQMWAGDCDCKLYVFVLTMQS